MEASKDSTSSNAPSIFEPKFWNYFDVANDKQALFDHFYKSLKKLKSTDFNDTVIENVKQMFSILSDHRKYYRKNFGDTQKSLKKKDDELKAAKNLIENLEKKAASEDSDQLHEKIKKYENQLFDEEQVIAKLKKRLKDAKEQAESDMNVALAEFKKEQELYYDLQDKYEELQSEHLAAIKEKNAKATINQSLNDQIEQLKNELTIAQKQIKEASEQKAAYNKLMKMTKDINEKNNGKKKAEKVAQKERITKLEGEIKELSVQSDADSRTIQSLRDNNATLKEEKAAAEKINNELDEKIKMLESELSSQNEKIAKMKEEIEQLMEKQVADKNVIEWSRDISSKQAAALKEQKLEAEKLISELDEKTKLLENQIELTAAVHKELFLLKDQVEVQQEGQCQVQILPNRKRPKILSNTKNPKQRAIPSNIESQQQTTSFVNPSIVPPQMLQQQQQQHQQQQQMMHLQAQQQQLSNRAPIFQQQQKTFNPHLPGGNIHPQQINPQNRRQTLQQIQNTAVPQQQGHPQQSVPYGMSIPQNAYHNFQQLVINNAAAPQATPSQFQQYLSHFYQQLPSYPGYANFNFTA